MVTVGSFIKDLGPQNRSMGYVKKIDRVTGLMLVMFPKTRSTHWCTIENFGQYIVIN